MRQSLDRFYEGLMVLAALAMALTFVVVVLGILDRQFALGLRGLDAYAGYGIASALFLAMPGTLQRGEHIRVTLLLQRLPPTWRNVLEWWCVLAGMALTWALAFYSCQLVWVSHLTHDMSQGADATPLWIPQIGMALGCIGLAVAFADAAVARLRGRPFFKHPAGASAASE
ncbi:MAG TPA: TRAP transporter small permease subunit [Rubrivivax sp.]|nr:TRAP transporter small permease subunit [Rubrivivax sp.]